MAKRKLKWNSEKILSLSAMSMSFITLLIFMYQTDLMKKQNYLSILPYLVVGDSHNRANLSYELDIYNHGVGPAIIESVTIIHQNKRYDLREHDNRVYSLLRTLAPRLDSVINYSTSTLERGLAIPANAEYNIFAVNNSTEDYLLMTSELERLLAEGLNFEIVYKSMQNEHWMISIDSEGPVKLD
ncbi:hypothetical protein [Muriicola sp. Z0-33]|uniref:hypothetical protein n=1 Tax=Muriicola sp. Z0-33 TaxID=2816957 RepID=UPI0022382EB2|nr:hypothetical protein [Muriicola sp. Z0-33]MCW5515512.1 hypothetical protein [Muriicola sp. Z0-33]